jgi:death-on-curing protein
MARTEPIWVPASTVLAMHAELIAEHGGLRGPARLAALEGALARPRQLHAYESKVRPTLAKLAAAYGHALAKGHCFPDGNKRIALAVMDAFLQLNGFEIVAGEPEVVGTVVALSAGTLTEHALAVWLAEHVARLGD